jgi:mono/diheme cytochrome c family protein
VKLLARAAAIVAICLVHARAGHAQPATPDRSASSGEEIYSSACLACHGADGKGASRAMVGFDTRLPDFTNCAFSTSEPDSDWASTVHVGGRVRGMAANMPAFGDALSDADIARVIAYVRSFCSSASWPSGNLNLPRALVTEKAFPDNEAFVTTAVPTSDTDRVETRFVFERRLGARSQYEVAIPFKDVSWPGGWNHGLGDVAASFKHVVLADASRGSILSGGVEMTWPTGKETEGLGNRLAVLEPSASFSQILPHDAFVHGQAGIGIPLNVQTATKDVFWRAAIGRTVAAGRWGRLWSPMVEVLAVHELSEAEPTRWDLLPEVQVTLNRRQHVLATAGLRVPVNLRTRPASAMASLLWSWSQGSLFAGW